MGGIVSTPEKGIMIQNGLEKSEKESGTPPHPQT